MKTIFNLFVIVAKRQILPISGELTLEGNFDLLVLHKQSVHIWGYRKRTK